MRLLGLFGELPSLTLGPSPLIAPPIAPIV